jgi:dipeptidyl aminopeptidase/acylaminoacyl peptidase
MDIYRIPGVGGKPIRVTVGAGSKLAPSWSPDGRSIGYTLTAGGETQIYRIPARGGIPEKLSDHPGVNQITLWSPDSRRIAYVSVRPDERHEIRVIPLSDPERSTVVHEEDVVYPLCWSEDGRDILYFSRRNGEWTVHARPVAGGAEILVGREPGPDEEHFHFIDLTDAGRAYAGAIYRGGAHVFSDGDDTAEVCVIRVEDVLETSLQASRRSP